MQILNPTNIPAVGTPTLLTGTSTYTYTVDSLSVSSTTSTVGTLLILHSFAGNDSPVWLGNVGNDEEIVIPVGIDLSDGASIKADSSNSNMWIRANGIKSYRQPTQFLANQISSTTGSAIVTNIAKEAITFNGIEFFNMDTVNRTVSIYIGTAASDAFKRKVITIPALSSDSYIPKVAVQLDSIGESIYLAADVANRVNYATTIMYHVLEA